MDILKKDITIDKKIGKETSQVLVEGDIIVPDTKPDIDMVLEANAVAYIDSKDIVNDRITFKGNLDINVLFVAKAENKPIYNMQYTYPINDFINMDGIDKSMTVFTTCNITNLDYKLINDRKVSFRAILDVTSEVLSKENIEIVSSIDGLDEKQMKVTNININKVACTKFDRFNIKDDIEISSGRPNIKEILDISFNIANKDIKTQLEKINISGDVRACILYKSDEEDSMITYFEQDIPFNGAIEVEGATDDMIGDVYLDIQEKNVQILEDVEGNPRVIGIDIYVGCNIKVSYEDKMNILEDAYALDKQINIEKNMQSYPMLICKNKNQASIKEIIKLDEECPPILQVLKVSGKPILDNIEILENKVVAEGIVECKILYITNNDEYPMYCFNTIIPYSQAIDTKGTKPDMVKVDINSSLEHIGINMMSDKDVEVRCAINFDTCVTKEKEISFITDVVFDEVDEQFLDSIASMIIYVVQPGDTLWCLAKKFNTTVDDIVSLNDIENPDLIYPGQKLLILKKIC
ncbi:DUF3794 and LysM peptidoglycan-binding domain-containing protein [[Clostridium] colinum]|uniref:DUF3794 and LysM peptidoglycan-binding domain-containing protein n=1 Tax=[Clostridium] colinum TaxID=36835 RepID=UPI0020256CF0|nr:SPOCS domain-containing protein [[Clostridium] colinum]